MTRTIEANAQTEIDTEQGTTPKIVLEIVWPTVGAKYYGDTVMASPKTVIGSILQIDGFDESFTIGGAANVNVVNVLLSDDDALKILTDTYNILGLAATVYLVYDSLAFNEWITLTKGKIGGPINWSEADRTLGFTVFSDWGYETAGFSLRADDEVSASAMNPLASAVGKPWPMCFGSSLRVPALKILEPFKAVVEDDEQVVISGEVELKISYETGSPPVGEETYSIAGIKCTGTIAGDILTIPSGQMNETWYTNVSIASRVADADQKNYNVMWITNSSIELAGKYCYTGGRFGYCVRQEGAKCWFFNAIYDPAISAAPSVFTEVRGAIKSNWNTYESILKIVHYIRSGAVMYWVDDTVDQVVYIANLFTGGDVAEVMANRAFGPDDRIKLAAVPSSRFTIDYTYDVPDRYKVDHPNANTICTAIIFDPGLYTYELEKWEDDVIYVSMESFVGSNPAETIDALLNYYSDLTSDATTYTAVKAALTNYPMHGYVAEEINVWDLVQDLAWQARTALFARNDEIFYVYLSDEPGGSADTFDDAATIEKSISIALPDDTDLITNVNSHWGLDGSQDKTFEVTLTNNINLYGSKKEQYDFYAYNIKALVEKSTQFWLNRFSNVWKIVSVVSTLPRIGLEVGDYVIVNYADDHISTDGTVGLILGINYNSETHVIAYTIWTPVLAGTLVDESDAYLDDSGDSLPDDPIEGRTLVDYTPEIYNQQIVTAGGFLEVDSEAAVSKVYFARITNMGTTIATVDFYDTSGSLIVSGDWSGVTVNLIATTSPTSSVDVIPLLEVGHDIQVVKFSGDDEFYFNGGILTTVKRA